MAVYAVRADMYQLSASAQAFTNVATADQDAALATASRTADSYLTRRFVLPLISWDVDLKQAVTDIAAYRLLRARGFNPTKGDAEQMRLGYEDAIKWLKQVGDGAAIPSGLVDSSPAGINDTDAAGAQHVSARVLSPNTASCTPGSFWAEDGYVTGTGIGPPKPRGW